MSFSIFEVNAFSQGQSDFQTSYRLGRDRRYFFSHPEAYIEHLKPDCNVALQVNWLVGHDEPAVIWDLLPRT